MKIIIKMLGVIGVVLGLAMIVASWIYFFDTDNRDIYALVSLYISLAIAIAVMVIGSYVIGNAEEK